MAVSQAQENASLASYRDMTVIDMLVAVDIAGRLHDQRPLFQSLNGGGITAISASVAIWQSARDALNVIAGWRERFAENSDLIIPVVSAADLDEAKRLGKTGAMLSFQNTDPFENDLGLVGIFRSLGVVCAQLTYNIQNSVGSGAWEEYDRGLSSHLGRNMVKEMNDVGMLIDISHCGDQTCLDAIECSEKPVAVTHANPAEFVGAGAFGEYARSRNRSTEVIEALAASGGVIGLCTYTRILREGCDTTLEQFCDMVDWTVERIGIDHVGIGTDFTAPGYDSEGRDWVTNGRWSRHHAVELDKLKFMHADWSHPDHFSGIAAALEDRGWSTPDVAKFMGGNWRRLLGEVL